MKILITLCSELALVQLYSYEYYSNSIDTFKKSSNKTQGHTFSFHFIIFVADICTPCIVTIKMVTMLIMVNYFHG